MSDVNSDRIFSLVEGLARIEAKLDGLRSDFNRQDGDVKHLTTKISELDRRLSSVEDQVKTVNRRWTLVLGGATFVFTAAWGLASDWLRQKLGF
jgi:hypothetical protein